MGVNYRRVFYARKGVIICLRVQDVGFRNNSGRNAALDDTKATIALAFQERPAGINRRVGRASVIPDNALSG